jgi:serine protease Do
MFHTGSQYRIWSAVRRSIVVLSVVSGIAAVSLWGADTLRLQDNATVSGRILAEKPDLVVIDIGYTVLAIPRSAILEIIPSDMATDADHSDESPHGREESEVAHNKAGDNGQNGFRIIQGLYSEAVVPPVERSVREQVALLGESVVQVRTPSGLGSGFFINEDGHLITNFHVIEGETKISVEVYHVTNGQLERKSYKSVRIVAMNKFVDLALLKVEDEGAPVFARTLVGSVDAMSVGDRVFAIGSPLGLERTVTEGILSTKTRQVGGELYLQTTAQINPGNSGGPLFNMRGEVVGIINMKLTFGEGLGFAIPVEELKFFLRNRDAFAYDNDNPSNPFRYLEPPRRMDSGPLTP